MDNIHEELAAVLASVTGAERHLRSLLRSYRMLSKTADKARAGMGSGRLDGEEAGSGGGGGAVAKGRTRVHAAYAGQVAAMAAMKQAREGFVAADAAAREEGGDCADEGPDDGHADAVARALSTLELLHYIQSSPWDPQVRSQAQIDAMTAVLERYYELAQAHKAAEAAESDVALAEAPGAAGRAAGGGYDWDHTARALDALRRDWEPDDGLRGAPAIAALSADDLSIKAQPHTSYVLQWLPHELFPPMRRILRPPTPKLVYTSVDEVSQLARLQSELQARILDILVVRNTETQIIDGLLPSLDPADREFRAAARAAHSIVRHSGKAAPLVFAVRDE
ncbi:uncharacterized protein AMSG_08186 [Thecamonas trahens ATCC 50062]|uniref:Uncharacterized protein n=1 Tax=Thecamonas trahens ATCC 50062 TaxID=461836 RepID=A0A0L0DKR2_THETB|nr:hypothetical protein AMSG_08186 [Thecamonas trahens ATCC 50062]KNC51943.1 hypothetical protein AMSG_08186 [Thecamonas trahens ATCC 50062]|eukprot:XP_013755536.1 hypothetical protein AMSG_08186 [Thecamonas trahens ATCC 50062]